MPADKTNDPKLFREKKYILNCCWKCFLFVDQVALQSMNIVVSIPCRDRLVGLVVKASASRVEDPGFEYRLRRDFSGVESYQ